MGKGKKLITREERLQMINERLEEIKFQNLYANIGLMCILGEIELRETRAKMIKHDLDNYGFVTNPVVDIIKDIDEVLEIMEDDFEIYN